MGLGNIVSDAILYVFDHPAILAVGCLLYVFVFVLSVLMSAPKPGRNPFATDTRRPPKAIELRQEERDKVIKQGFSVKRVPDNLDAIVIGSGIGGLTTANILARAGKKVLVLEQHDQAGGCCHSFIEKGFEFDVGIHYIGEMHRDSMSQTLMDHLTDGQLQWSPLDQEYDVVALGPPGQSKLYPHLSGRDDWRAKMLEKFPNEKKAIDKYMALLKDVQNSSLGMVALKVKSKWFTRLIILSCFLRFFTNYFKYACLSTEYVLKKITNNADLRAVLAYNFGDYGVHPSKSPFIMQAFLANHFSGGSAYPVGGASEFAYHLIPKIQEMGGKVLVRAPVTNIICNNGRAIGVRVVKSGQQVDIYAPTVISDAGVVNTFKKLVPEELAQKTAIYRHIKEKRLKAGVAAMSMFVGLNGTKEELKLKAQNVWMLTDNDLSSLTEELLEKDVDDALQGDVPIMFISFPSAKDPTFNDRFPGKSTCTIVTFGRYEWFDSWKDGKVKNRGADYESIKKSFCTRMWEQTLLLYPHLRGKDEYMELGTPLSNNYYIGSTQGEIYGLDHSIQRFSNTDILMHLRPECEIPGLILTGQDIFTCGFSGAMFAGVLSASKVLNRNLYDDLVDFRKLSRKKKTN